LPFLGDKLKKIILFNNNLEQDLTIFSKHTNLEALCIGNRFVIIDGVIRNRFYGSLKPLKDLNNLKELHISNTDIDSGLEYLPDGLTDFYCGTSLGPSAKVEEILLLFNSSSNHEVNLAKKLPAAKFASSLKNNEKLEEELKVKKQEIAEQQTEIESLKIGTDTHLEALEVAKKQELLDQIKELEEKVSKLS
jgi:hypothetical protein